MWHNWKKNALDLSPAACMTNMTLKCKQTVIKVHVYKSTVFKSKVQITTLHIHVLFFQMFIIHINYDVHLSKYADTCTY